MNAQNEQTVDRDELARMIQSLNWPKLMIVQAVVNFFLALEWARKQARRFADWIGCHE